MTVLKIDVSESAAGDNDTPEKVLATIDFAEWHFAPEENDNLKKALADVVRSEMAEAFRNTLKWDPPSVSFESDGVNISVSIDLGAHIYFIASIEDMIDDYLWCTNPDDMAGGDEARIELAKTLRASADKLDAAVGTIVERKNPPGKVYPAWATEFVQEHMSKIETIIREAIKEPDKGSVDESLGHHSGPP